MRYYPAFLDLRNKPVVVIGGGKVAERKVRVLLSCGARVTVVSPVLTKNLGRLGRTGAIRHRKRRWRPADLKGAMLILAATNDRTANSEIASLADFRTRLVNAVDDPGRCSFIAPAVLARGDLIIAISTSGQSPAVARKLREELRQSIGPAYGAYLKLFARIRKQVQARVPSIAKRRQILNRLAASDLLTLLRKGRGHQVRKQIERITGLKEKGFRT